MTEQRVSFPTPDGLHLEGLLCQEAEGRGWIVLCHPHPLYGGDMYNNVIGGLHRALVQRGFSTLRFNFRGVGKSEGRYADGVGEKEDVRGAVEFAIEKADLPLFLVGYSFGAAVGTKAVVGDKRVKALLCISPPIAMYEFSSFKDDMRPKLFVAGDRDLVCPVKSLEEFFNALPQPKSIRIIQDVDHFWWGMEDRVADSVIDFLQGL